jgi:O-antigen ligase/polysaccharide polymerase Wzy-like membrane protein
VDLRGLGSNQIRDLSLTAGAVVLVILYAVVLLSIAILPNADWSVKTLLAGFCVLALVRPADALLVTTALLGFGIILSHLAGLPLLRVTDVLVAASLGGSAVHAVLPRSRFRSAITSWLSAAVVLFAVAAVASTLSWLRVYQMQWGQAAAYLHALSQFVSRDYFVQPGEFWVVVSTVAILQGLALFVAIAAWCQVDATFFARGLRMLTVGGAGLAMMSVARLAEVLLRDPAAVATMRRTYDGLRISPQIPDFIAAGSYFSLCWLAALGLAIAPGGRRQRVAWVLVSVPLLSGLYLTGSRSVIAAAFGGIIVFALISFVRLRVAASRAVIAGAILASVVMIGSFRWMVGHDIAGTQARASLSVRGELLRVGVRVIETRPLFGVGLDRFFLVAGTVKSPLLDSAWSSRRNPHNDLLRFAGELGLIGLGLFVWILGSASARIWRALRGASDSLLTGLAAGLVAFFITSMVSNPLMLREVSYAFWIALGLAVGRSATLPSSAPPPDDSVGAVSAAAARSHTIRRFLAVLLGVLLVVSIPFRAQQELTTVDPTRVTYGLSDWEREADGTRFRWSGPHATIYVSGRARRVEIPLRGTLPSFGVQHVKVRLNDRLINDVVVGPDWQRLGIVLLGGDLTKPYRVELDVSPTSVRANPISPSDDRTVVGVKVGELNIVH